MSEVKLTVSSSPHIFTEKNIQSVMFDVVIALIPALLVGFFYFGFNSAVITVVACLSALFFEWAFLKISGKTNIKATILDGSAIITGLLLAMNLPASSPWWMVAVGGFVAIVIGKQVFGGLGYNIFNPALVARVFLLISFPVQMTKWTEPVKYFTADGVTAPTPLGMLKTEGLAAVLSHFSYADYIQGNIGGSFGEVSAIALLIGGIYLLLRKVISWEIPISLLLTLGIFTGIFWYVNPEKYASPLFHITTGGAVLGAFFMATDMVTSPITKKGMLIFGCAIGLITGIIRLFGGYPEGISFAILIMNAFVPLIDKATKQKKFGEVVQ
jgi:electron transport complex protein RnfD